MNVLTKCGFKPLACQMRCTDSFADAADFSHPAAAPLGCLRRRCLRPGNNFGLLGANKGLEAPPARTTLIKSRHAAFGKARPPINDRQAGCFEFPGQRVVRLAFRRAEHDPRPQRDALHRLARTDNPFKFPPVLGRYRQCRAVCLHVAQSNTGESHCQALRETIYYSGPSREGSRNKKPG